MLGIGPVQIAAKFERDISVFYLSGRRDSETSSEALHTLSQLVDERPGQVVLNLEGLEYISSIGFRVLLTLAKQLRTSDRAMGLCNVTGKVKEVFDISGFAAVFNVFDSEATAQTEFRRMLFERAGAQFDAAASSWRN